MITRVIIIGRCTDMAMLYFFNIIFNSSGIDHDERPYLSWAILRESLRMVTKLATPNLLTANKDTAEKLRSGFDLLRVFSKSTEDGKGIMNENIDQLDIFLQDYKV